MNTTEAMAICLAMALAYGEEKGVTRQQRQALLKWGKKVRTAQAKLDRTRKARMLSQLAGVSAEDLRAEMKRILPCHECGAVAGNPLLSCKGMDAFECALSRSRVRSSPLV